MTHDEIKQAVAAGIFFTYMNPVVYYRPQKEDLFRIPHKPPAGSLKVLHAPARQGGIRRTSQTKIYNLETDEFISNPPFLKTNFARVISYPTFWWEQLELI